MKKFYILVAVFFSSLVFCTKENPADISAKSDYSDSITIDLFSYKIYCTEVNTYYCDSLKITAKGQPFLQPLDSSIFKIFSDPYSYTICPAIVPKYIPSKFEAWANDSMPLLMVDSTDTNVLTTLYTLSSTTASYRLDTSSANANRCIRPIDVSYLYGYGFILNISAQELWGIGNIKIYYK